MLTKSFHQQHDPTHHQKYLPTEVLPIQILSNPAETQQRQTEDLTVQHDNQPYTPLVHCRNKVYYLQYSALFAPSIFYQWGGQTFIIFPQNS